jgi:hypothetical protein
MGFHKRYYTRERIVGQAKYNDYDSFERYMIKADSQEFEHEETYGLWDSFLKAPLDERKNIYQTLRNA